MKVSGVTLGLQPEIPDGDWTLLRQPLVRHPGPGRQGLGHWRPQLRDPKDEFVLELAVAAGCRAIITHNRRDFTGADRLGVEILAPREFLHKLEETL